jgi:23S rRNA pseudouridine1911/1915/1917 synthase
VIAVVPAALAGERVDRALSTLTGVSRKVAAELVSAGSVRIDGAVVLQRSSKVLGGERLEVLDTEPSETEDLGAGAVGTGAVGTGAVGTGPREGHDAGVSFTVVHEDDHLIVVDKPPGLVVHHGAGHNEGTLVDGLVERFSDLAVLADQMAASGSGDPTRPGIVHRLDKGTSGLMVIARTEQAASSLSEQLRTKQAGREYLALVAGTLVHDAGVVDAAVGRSNRVATRMAVTPKGRPARTAYRVLERIEGPPDCTLIEAKLETGRTHQVRVHMAAIGHPVGGDDRYGERPRTTAVVAGADPPIEPGRLFLHAHRLTFDHPAGGRVSWTSPLPADLEAVLSSRRLPAQAAR